MPNGEIIITIKTIQSQFGYLHRRSDPEPKIHDGLAISKFTYSIKSDALCSPHENW